MKNETVKKKSVKSTKNLQLFLLSNGSSIEVSKYKEFVITQTPKTEYPEMVTISRTPHHLKKLHGKRFVNLQKAKTYIDFQLSSQLVKKETIKSEKDEFIDYKAHGIDEYEDWLFISDQYRRAGLNTERLYDY